jgi:hypothetical protein
MARVRGSVVVLLLGVVALAGCGGGSSGSATDDGNTTTVASAASTSSAPATPTLQGLYFLTGTQTCKSALGGGSTAPFPLFAGSTIAVAGDRAIATLRSDPPEASITTDGSLFHITVTYDATTNAPVTTVAGATPSSLDLVLNLSGTISDDGQTITGKGIDTGVNCEYDFTGSNRVFGGGDGTGDCGGEGGLTETVAATPRSDGLQFTAADVIVDLMTADQQFARYGIGQAAFGYAGCDGDQWKLADDAAARIALCGDEPQPEIAEALEVDCTAATATSVPEPSSTSPTVPSGSCDKQGALDATIALHPDTVARSLDFVLACENGWAVVTYGTGDADLMELLVQRDGAWVEYNELVCDAPEVPESVSFLICMTG